MPAPLFSASGAGDRLMRLMDHAIAIVGLGVTAPLWLVVMPLLRFTGEGEIFYRQMRIGRGRRPFGLLKFSTMVKNSSSIGAGELTLPDDPRVLPVGRFLRRTKINELPQLLNVLSGDLSIVGPRPQTERYFLAYKPEVRERIASVRPGLTGVGSTIFRNEEAIFAQVPDPIDFDMRVMVPYKGRIEGWFVEHRSPALYIELLLTTVLVVLFPRANLHRRLLSRLPAPPAELAKLL